MSPEKIKDSLVQLGYKLADRGSYWQTITRQLYKYIKTQEYGKTMLLKVNFLHLKD